MIEVKLKLELRHLKKRYGQNLALDNVNLTLEKGEVYGLIGRNGAGKTTLIKVITKLIRPSQGSVSLFHSTSKSEWTHALKRVGSVIETPVALNHLNARQNLRYYCKIHHVPNPEAKEAIESIKKAVLDNNADFGIIFDADGDRSAFIDNTGREINRNNLIALLSDILLKQTPGATIVTDSVTSAGLKKFIENHGGKHHRFKRGYKNVINEAKRLNNEGIYTPLAIETSGHAAFINNYFLYQDHYS